MNQLLGEVSWRSCAKSGFSMCIYRCSIRLEHADVFLQYYRLLLWSFPVEELPAWRVQSGAGKRGSFSIEAAGTSRYATALFLREAVLWLLLQTSLACCVKVCMREATNSEAVCEFMAASVVSQQTCFRQSSSTGTTSWISTM